MKTTRKTLCMAGPLLPAIGHAQISFVSDSAGANEVSFSNNFGLLSENFNALGTTSGTWTDNTTLPGWYANKASITQTAGGGSTTGAMYNYGTNNSDPDRSLGGQPNTQADGLIVLGLRLVNNTGTALTQVNVDYFVEQWRREAAAATAVTLDYRYFAPTQGSIASEGWTFLTTLSPNVGGGTGSINGNLADHRFAQSASITNTEWADGDELWLRWSITKASGPNIHLAIDDLTVGVIPEPSTYATLAGLLVLGLALWRRRHA